MVYFIISTTVHMIEITNSLFFPQITLCLKYLLTRRETEMKKKNVELPLKLSKTTHDSIKVNDTFTFILLSLEIKEIVLATVLVNGVLVIHTY